tara:strand:- start:485 stop:850 length:366 start_codon:yes stop_codon:yes gene_type:complete
MADFIKAREEILQKMGQIDYMQPGRLTEEFRLKQVMGETVRHGPYYKYQVWKNGKNTSMRIPSEKAQQLQRAIEGMDEFKRLSQQFVDVTVAMTEEQASEDFFSKIPKTSVKKSSRKRKNS